MMEVDSSLVDELETEQKELPPEEQTPFRPETKYDDGDRQMIPLETKKRKRNDLPLSDFEQEQQRLEIKTDSLNLDVKRLEFIKYSLDVYERVMTADWLPKDDPVLCAVRSTVTALIQVPTNPIQVDDKQPPSVPEKKQLPTKSSKKPLTDFHFNEFFHLLTVNYWREKLRTKGDHHPESGFIYSLLNNEFQSSGYNFDSSAIHRCVQSEQLLAGELFTCYKAWFKCAYTTSKCSIETFVSELESLIIPKKTPAGALYQLHLLRLNLDDGTYERLLKVVGKK